MVALRDLGAECQRLIFCEATELFLSRERLPIQTVQDFSNAAMEGEFSSLDSRIYACVPSLSERLQTHLALHQSSFVIIT
jgi:hypothetical protein